MKRTAKHYKRNSKSYAKKKAYDKEFNKKPEQMKKRAELKRIRRRAKKEGKSIEGKDYDHRDGKFKSISANRGAREKSRLKGSKRKAKRRND